MSSMLPVNYSSAGTNGAADTVAMVVSGIKSGDVLLACIAWDPAGGDPSGIDVSEATVADGTVTLDTTSTADKLVWLMWATPNDS